jgi:hypothetical protein
LFPVPALLLVIDDSYDEGEQELGSYINGRKGFVDFVEQESYIDDKY